MPNVNSLMLFPTVPQEILQIGSELRTNASFGVDSIPMHLIHICLPYIALPLSKLINCSFLNGIFPDALKIAKICPIYKSDEKNLIPNYRPISILLAFSKIYEKAIHKRLISFLDKNNILIPNQYGFRKNNSTDMAMIDLYDIISKAIDEDKFVLS